MVDFKKYGVADEERLGFILKHNETDWDIQGDIHIGKRVKIQEGARIGAWAMTFERTEDGTIVRAKQIGGVWIGDDVEIGANTVICRGTTLNDTTVIEVNTKIDNLVDIAHNCKIGHDVYIGPGTMIFGGVHIGDYSTISGGVTIRNHVKIGHHCLIGQAANVTKDIPDYSIVYGNPARVMGMVKMGYDRI